MTLILIFSIDSGSTHSFIPKRLALLANKTVEPLECGLLVFTPMGKSLEADFVLKDRHVLVGKQKLEANLILLDIHDFDVILGMD